MTSSGGDGYAGDYFGAPQQPAPVPSETPAELNRFGLPAIQPVAVAPRAPSLQPHELSQMLSADPGGLAKSMRGSAHPTSGRLGFGRSISAGLDLTRTTGRILRKQPALLGVTVITFLAGVIVVFGYFTLMGGADQVLSGGRLTSAVKMFPIAAATSVIGALGSAVIVGATMMRFQGDQPSLGKAWAQALARLPQLALWGVVFAAQRTISGLLRGNRIGRIVSSVFDRAWDFATYLAVPVILFENVQNPFQTVKRSATLVRGRWGAQAVAQGAIFLALLVCSVPLLLVVIWVAVYVSGTLGVALFFLLLLSLVVVSSTLGGILSAAMYRFAISGFTSEGFIERDLWAAFGGQQFGSLRGGGFA